MITTRPRRAAIIARKGGVGKTTTTVQLAMALVLIYNIEVLVVDCDPQGNATARLGVKEGEAARTMNDVFAWTITSEVGIAPAIHPTRWPGISVVASEEALKSREAEGEEVADYRLRIAFERSEPELARFGAILFDTPPGTGGLLRNAMIAADVALAVTDPEPDGLKGAAKALAAAESIRERQNPGLDILGVLVNRYDASMGEHARCVADLVAATGEDQVWQPMVTERASVKTARGLARPVQDIKDNGARAYVRAMNDHARRLGRALNLQEI